MTVTSQMATVLCAPKMNVILNPFWDSSWLLSNCLLGVLPGCMYVCLWSVIPAMRSGCLQIILNEPTIGAGSALRQCLCYKKFEGRGWLTKFSCLGIKVPQLKAAWFPPQASSLPIGPGLSLNRHCICRVCLPVLWGIIWPTTWG